MLLPIAGYTTLAVAAALVPTHFREALFMVAGTVLVLVFTGIHNAWDAIAYHVLVR